MKKIYTFTLDSDDYPSRGLHDDVRVIAALVYDCIYNYYGEDNVPVSTSKNIVYNELRDAYHVDGKYIMDSDKNDDGYINYEPFISGRRTFGFTVVDDSIGHSELREKVNYILSLVRVNYRVSIECFPYPSKDMDDESNRDAVINAINSRFGERYVRRNKLCRILRKRTYPGNPRRR